MEASADIVLPPKGTGAILAGIPSPLPLVLQLLATLLDELDVVCTLYNMEVQPAVVMYRHMYALGICSNALIKSFILIVISLITNIRQTAGYNLFHKNN